jgi:hypothetical protein
MFVNCQLENLYGKTRMLTNILAQAESVKPSISLKIAVRAIPSGQGSDP